MTTQYIRYPSSSGSIPTYANFAALPATASDGAAAITVDTDTLYIYNLATTTWLPVGGSSVALSVGTINSQTKSANGAVLASNQIVMQSAQSNRPGLVYSERGTVALGNNVNSVTVTLSNAFSGATYIIKDSFKNTVDAAVDLIFFSEPITTAQAAGSYTRLFSAYTNSTNYIYQYEVVLI